MNDLTISALIDTGADVCLMRYDMYKCAGISNLSDNRLILGGIKGSKVCTLGSFEVNIEVDGINFEVTFHVTELNDLPCKVILGNNILKSVNICFSEKGAEFGRKELKILSDEDSLETRHVCQSKIESDFVDDKGFKVKEEEDNAIGSNLALTEFAALCEAFDENDVNPDPASNLDLGHLNVKIQAIDDFPFYHTPRHVSCADQKRIDNWLSERQSNSEHASTVVLVLKKDGTKRICCSFRKRNKNIIRNNFSMMTFQNWLKRISVRYKENISIDGKFRRWARTQGDERLK
uniref:Peptidase A2 domain-containing protein n=1 Tax=Bactrocera latifrons TaxID=174628 RepID=A0A0K8U9A2_BACLA